MNIVDIVILCMVAASLLWALYRGFVHTLLSLLSCLIALMLAYLLAPLVTGPLLSNTGVTTTLASYTDAFSRVGDLELSMTQTAALDEAGITRVVEAVSLPAPLDNVLRVNLQNRVYGLGTVNDYVTSTLVTAIVDIIAYAVCFAALCVALSILNNFIRSVFHYPLLRQLDWAAAAVFGLMRGVLICYVAFTLVPVLRAALPLQLIDEALAGSRLLGAVSSGNMIISILNGHM